MATVTAAALRSARTSSSVVPAPRHATGGKTYGSRVADSGSRDAEPPHRAGSRPRGSYSTRGDPQFLRISASAGFAPAPAWRRRGRRAARRPERPRRRRGGPSCGVLFERPVQFTRRSRRAPSAQQAPGDHVVRDGSCSTSSSERRASERALSQSPACMLVHGSFDMRLRDREARGQQREQQRTPPQRGPGTRLAGRAWPGRACPAARSRDAGGRAPRHRARRARRSRQASPTPSRHRGNRPGDGRCQ